MMLQKLLRILAVSVVVLGMAMSPALSETEFVSGKVKSVDAEKGTLVLVTEEGDTKTLAVPKEMLKGVKPGHEVDVEIADGKVTGLENYSADS